MLPFKPGRCSKMQGVVRHVQRPKHCIERLGYMSISVTVIVYVTHGVTCRARMASTAMLVWGSSPRATPPTQDPEERTAQM